MELGNMIFGHSRGEYPVSRDEGYEWELRYLWDALSSEAWAIPTYENEVFAVRPYYWGDCDPACTEETHVPACPCVLPNFLFKPTGYELRWYKYPLRDSYASHELTRREFRTMIDACLASLPAGPIGPEKGEA